MSEPSQQIRIGGGGFNPRPLAENILRLLKDNDNPRVPADLHLPDGKTLRVWVTTEGWFGNKLKISLDEDQWGCRSCLATVEAVKLKGVTVDNISELLERAFNSVQSCPNCSKNGAAAGSGGVTPDPAASPGSAAPEPAGSRVKVIGDGAAGATTATSVAQQPEPKPQIKITNPGAKGSGGTLQLGRPRPAQSVPGHVHHSVSVSYFYDRTRVEVTIPHHICEELVSHCGGSNQHNNEVGGLLVGLQEEVKVERNDSKQLRVVVTDLVRLKAAASSVSHLEVSADEWARVGRIFDEKYAPQNKVRLGWYHTHPTQGIFFSPPDVHTHTNFTLPYQFGLVISPREMVAGLLYWVNYPEGVSDPIKFPLRRVANTVQGPGGGVRPPQTLDAEFLPISKGRVVFVVVMTLMAFLYVITTSPWMETTPANACLLAFNAFAILRLRNARFFRPYDPFERRVFEVVYDGSRAFVRWFNGWSPLPFAYTATLVTFGLLLLLLVRTQTGWGPSRLWTPNRQSGQPQQQRQQQQPGAGDTQGQGNGHTVQAKQLQISKELPRRMRVYFEGDSIVFFNDDRGWTPETPDKEKVFFNRTFNLDLSDEKAVRYFQKWAYEAYADTRSPDGRWGGVTRNVVLNLLQQAQMTQRPLRVRWRGDQPEFEIRVR